MIPLAYWRDPLSGERHLIKVDGSKSILAIGTSRSGKTAGLILPAALAWSHAMLVHDIKGEIYELSHKHRMTLGPIYKFAPGERDSCAFNPLDAIRPNHEDADARNIAITLGEVDGPLHGENAHWRECAQDLLAGVILYCRARNPGAGLGDVLQAFGRGNKLFEEMAKEPDEEIAGPANSQLARADREASSVFSSAVRYLFPWRDQWVRTNTGHSDFGLDTLCDETMPATVYLCSPARDARRLASVQRLLLSTIVAHLMDRPLRFDGTRPLPAWRHRMCLLIDELAALGQSRVLEDALSRLAGYGCTGICAVQTMRQIDQVYGAHQSITANTPIRVIYGVAETSDAKWVSEQLGLTTQAVEQRSRHGMRFGLGGSTSVGVAFNPRPLLTPDEVISRDSSSVLVIGATRHPIRAERLSYWQDDVMSERAAPTGKVDPAGEPFPILPPVWLDQTKPVGRAVMAAAAVAIPALVAWWIGAIPLSNKPLPTVHVPAVVTEAGAMADALPALDFGTVANGQIGHLPTQPASPRYEATMKRLCSNVGKVPIAACKGFTP